MISRKSRYTFHSDLGHAWVAVKRAELRRLGLLDEISRYSYQNGETVYLEEDCDAALFIAKKESLGEPLTFREKHKDTDHYIRKFSSYSN